MPGRKLFLTHAGELAHRLVSAIARDAMAMEFVRRYAERHDRLKVVANLQRLREVESTISREALLLIAADVRRQLPQAFGFSRNPRPEELALCEVFYTEFLEALGRSLEWPLAEAETEAQAFRRDLETYVRWRERNPLPLRVSKAAADESPFPDRCAILLDSAMMEQARRAAKQFQSDVVRLGMRIFGQLGRYPTQRRGTSATKSRSAANPGKRRPVGDKKKELRPTRKSARSAQRPRRGR